MRRVVAAVAVAGALALAGCTGGSDGSSSGSGGVTVTDAQTTGSTTSSSTSPAGSDTAPPTVLSSTPGTSTSPSTSSPVATASVAQPPDPVVADGNAGAWSLTRAAPGAPQTRQLATVTCGQDGSVTADGLQLSAGAASLTLTDPVVTVTGTADLDAAGGTFRGRSADTAVTFTWTC